MTSLNEPQGEWNRYKMDRAIAEFLHLKSVSDCIAPLTPIVIKSFCINELDFDFGL